MPQPETAETPDVGDPVQLFLVLPYQFQPRDDGRVRRYLDQGYRIAQLQRVSDREVIVTLARRRGGEPTPGRASSRPG